MSDVQSGLEGVVAFATEIAEPDKAGGALRYRGVDIEDLVGQVAVRARVGAARGRHLRPGARARPSRIRSTCAPATTASTSSPRWPCWRPSTASGALIDITDEQARDDLARASVQALSFVAQSARGPGPAVGPAERGRQGAHDRRALPDALARRGRPRPRQGDRRLLDLRGRARDERLDLHRARRRLDRRRRRRGAVQRGRRAERPAARRRAVARAEDARRRRAAGRRRALRQGAAGPRRAAHGLRPPRVPRRGPAGARAAPDRARASARGASRSPRRSSRRRWPSCTRASPTASWPRTSSSGRPSCWTRPRSRADLFTPMFTCARVAGWSAHILEQKREARLIRPTAKYVGPAPRARQEVGREPAAA